VAIKNSYEKWSGGSEGEMRGETTKLEAGERVLTKKQTKEYGERGEGRMQSDRVRPHGQTMPEQAKQAKAGEYPWTVEGDSHNEVMDRQHEHSGGIHRQILEGQNFDSKELEGDRDSAFAAHRLLASKASGKLPKGQGRGR
jgi:hypothetical protein